MTYDPKNNSLYSGKPVNRKTQEELDRIFASEGLVRAVEQGTNDVLAGRISTTRQGESLADLMERAARDYNAGNGSVIDSNERPSLS